MTASYNLLSVPDARALINTQLTDAQLSDVIRREEAALARALYWPGALDEAATQTFYVSDPAMRGMYIDTAFFTPANAGRSLSFGWITANTRTPLWLLRPADPDTVVVKDGDTTLDSSNVRILRRGTVIERGDGAWKGVAVSVTYTPADLDEVTRVLIEYVRLTLSETGFESETIGDYTYRRGSAPRHSGDWDRRSALLRSLRTHWPVGTVRIPSSSEDRRIGGIVQS